MYQPIRIYDYERRESSGYSCLLVFIAMVSIVGFAVICVVSIDSFRTPFATLMEETEASKAFYSFMQEYGKSYANEAEQETRRRIFMKNYKTIQELNKEDPTVTFGVNEFADLTDEEFEDQYLDPAGVNEKCTVAQHEVWNNPREPVEPNDDLNINWVEKGKVSPVKNQGPCGSCWTFATTTVLETIYAIRENNLIQFAEQQIVDCCKKGRADECKISNGCNGGLVAEGFQYAINKGVMMGKDYPYTANDKRACKYDASKTVYKPQSFVDIKASDVAEMEKVLMTRSIAVGLSASHAVFRYYKKGVIDDKCPETPLNHGVAIVGAGTEISTGKKFWLVRNSWGRTWGDGGYIKLSRELNKYPTGVCGVASCPEYVKYKE